MFGTVIQSDLLGFTLAIPAIRPAGAFILRAIGNCAVGLILVALPALLLAEGECARAVYLARAPVHLPAIVGMHAVR